MTQPMMVVIGQKVGAYRDGMEIYGRSTASKDRQLVSGRLVALRSLRQSPSRCVWRWKRWCRPSRRI
ncbi:hypothetical protein [Nitrobacter sp. Nb-311A]|uniref:hypothetical protein n=1 Tax=Nitrobacter sp. Nb-311A TaxID=314253 RepID=UPI001FD87A3F|nr:hypothetical protein [Nitrobacter sp. Nb-311A]